MAENGEDKTPIQRIVITFPQKDGAELKIDVEGCSYAQIYGAAWFFNEWAREVRAQSKQPQPGKRILVPVASPSDRALGIS